MNATKEAVFAVIAAETRATLDSVADWMHLVGKHPLDSHTREIAFTAIERAARKELELLDEVLDVARAERGEVHREVLEVDLDDLLGSAVDAVTRSELGVRIECVGLGDDVALVRGERNRLEAAFERLLSSAVRSTRRGAAVTVALRKRPGAWTVRVGHPVRTDVEPEIDADCCLRLALVRAVIHAHGGTLEAFIDDARGVRAFVASLPCAPR